MLFLEVIFNALMHAHLKLGRCKFDILVLPSVRSKTIKSDLDKRIKKIKNKAYILLKHT